ncbi:MAG TPA: response regulator FixJ [Caulobacteraceae bacterium]
MAQEALVHVIDDDEAMRTSLSFLLAACGLPARTYESPTGFLDIAPTLNAGCIITDVRMPEMNGLELVRRVRAMSVRLPIIVITGHGDVPLAVEAMKAGAAEFLEKPFVDEVLLAAVREALKPPATGCGQLQPRLDNLSVRERQVLERLVAGHSNKLIGRDLGISDRTVEIYRAKVMDKMEAETFAELVRMAMKASITADSIDS